MIRHAKPLLLAAAAALLAACASAPMHYYTLLPSASAEAPNPAASLAFELLPVSVPAQVDQPQLVVREGGQSVALLEGERWIAPLVDEVHGALAVDLARELPGRDVGGMPSSGKPVLQVRLDLRRFDSQPGSYALLDGAWGVRLLHGTRPASLACSSRIRESVAPGYAALVQGHQRALHELAGQIAKVAQALEAGRSASCPAD
ncbi:MAG: membrane integrity-associated transporter subunit PqiC [Rhodanobacter sp.]|nr:MAG: membrane integrity-associated transporter subunit PqiC [Rhodanobacter sp.]TAL98893.1 MAG: membrane integrity-associated transporter subunit PqiC [Rhodanobacter sp.]TAM38386.1 MAG: membrane integrity-associated transporter subunit PqiC [Rhodanobacter sp.]TAN27873.1 MAG: membrane integrity-associated transporter subunit PqiC [Rhodanobacter sp.]